MENLVSFSGRSVNHADGESLRSLVSVVERNRQSKGNCMVDLKLGRLGDFDDGLRDFKAPCSASSVSVSCGSSRRTRSTSSNPVAACIVDDCNADLSGCKDYTKRHRVCEAHSKAVKVTVKGLEKRFCQQCRKFHVLAEFDEVKRSCRKRLDGHNKRRRKTLPDMSAGSSFTTIQGTRFRSYMNRHNVTTGIEERSWTAEFVKFEGQNVYNHQMHMLPMNAQQSFLVPLHRYWKGSKHLPFLQNDGAKLQIKPIETSVCQPLVTTIAAPGTTGSIFPDSLLRDKL